MKRRRGEETKTRVVDLKKLMRLILASQSYQRSSQASKGNEPDERFYSRDYPKRLKAEVLLDIMSQVSGSPKPFKDFPAGTRAMQLPDVNIASEFLKTFGRTEHDTGSAHLEWRDSDQKTGAQRQPAEQAA